MNKAPEFLIFPSWLFCWYFTPLGTGRQHMGLLDKHPTLSRSAKRHCYCYCLMPCTSIVVVPQSTHTYVIKLRGSGTIQAIVTPNSDQHKGPHQSRSKLTLALHNCFPGLEMTVFCVFFSLECRLTWLVPVGSYLAFVILLVYSHLLRVLAFLRMTRVDGWWWEFSEGEGQEVMGHFGVTAKIFFFLRASVSFYVWVCVCASKGKRRWLCQGWLITVVFSALRGGSDGCDGWLAVWPPSSRLSPALCLEIWAGVEGWGAGLRGGWGWTHLALVRQRLCARLKKKGKKSLFSGSLY